MCFIICIQVCVGVFCQLQIPDPSPHNSLHRARHWSSYNCYSFFFFLSAYWGKWWKKASLLFATWRRQWRRSLTGPLSWNPQPAQCLPWTHDVEDLPELSPSSEIISYLLDGWWFYFNLLSQCKMHKSLSDIYINDPCIAGQKTRLIRNVWSLPDS